MEGFVTLLKECAEHSSSWTEALDEFEGIGGSFDDRP